MRKRKFEDCPSCHGVHPASCAHQVIHERIRARILLSRTGPATNIRPAGPHKQHRTKPRHQVTQELNQLRMEIPDKVDGRMKDYS